MTTAGGDTRRLKGNILAGHRTGAYQTNGAADRVPPGAAFSLARLWPVAAVLAILAIGYALGLHRYLTPEALAEQRDTLTGYVDRNPAVSAAAYVLAYAAAVALSFPGATVLTVAGGIMFGWLLGGALAVLAATLGAVGIFLIATTSVGDALASRAGPRLSRAREGFRENAFGYLLFLRLAPLFPFWLVNLAAALVGMRLATYVAATAIGIVPATFAYAYFGEGLGTAIAGDGDVLSPKLFAGLAVLAFAALLPILLKRWSQGRRAKSPA